MAKFRSGASAFLLFSRKRRSFAGIAWAYRSAWRRRMARSHWPSRATLSSPAALIGRPLCRTPFQKLKLDFAFRTPKSEKLENFQTEENKENIEKHLFSSSTQVLTIFGHYFRRNRVAQINLLEQFLSMFKLLYFWIVYGQK